MCLNTGTQAGKVISIIVTFLLRYCTILAWGDCNQSDDPCTAIMLRTQISLPLSQIFLSTALWHCLSALLPSGLPINQTVCLANAPDDERVSSLNSHKGLPLPHLSHPANEQLQRTGKLGKLVRIHLATNGPMLRRNTEKAHDRCYQRFVGLVLLVARAQ